MTYIKAFESFISNNQLFLTALLLCGSYFLKRLVGAAAPSTPAEGTMYFNSTDKHFYGWNGTSWVQLDN